MIYFSENEINTILKTYRLMTGNDISLNNLKKDLNKRWRRFYSKFNQLVPKIICNIVCEHRRMFAPTTVKDRYQRI